MQITRAGECVHIIERRLFPDDVRRHFVGEIEAVSGSALRIRGFLFVFDPSSGFVKKPEMRTRIIPLDNRVIINLLPAATALDSVHYTHDAEGNLTLTDGSSFELDVSEFGPKG